MDLGRVKAGMRRPVLVDGRNLLDPEVVRSHGFVYLGVGRPDRVQEPPVLEPQAKEA
jgi:hypothetical protein